MTIDQYNDKLEWLGLELGRMNDHPIVLLPIVRSC